VQGDSRRKGELFGVRNLFRVNPAGQCLTADILRRNQAMEEKVRGRSRLAVAIQVPVSFSLLALYSFSKTGDVVNGLDVLTKQKCRVEQWEIHLKNQLSIILQYSCLSTRRNINT
jgi:hypothetical protein